MGKVRMKPTYEELKPLTGRHEAEVTAGMKPTYEELKLRPEGEAREVGRE